MAEPTDLDKQIAEAHDAAGANGPLKGSKAYHRERRVRAVSLRLSGLTWEQIGERLEITPDAARQMVVRSLSVAEQRNADEMRDVENARLDRAQAAIWPDVLRGDLKAIGTFLRISDRRARLNGLDAPSKVEMSVSIRQEMEEALSTLEKIVIEGEVVAEETRDAPDVVEAEVQAAIEYPYSESIEAEEVIPDGTERE